MTSSASLPATPAAPPAKPDPKIAMGWLHTAKFLTTAPELKHLPRIDVPEIAFVGRSNAGKSTCINTLTQQHRLAFASKTPGRTQSINLFSLGKQGITDAVLTDLPGYGYAAVPKEAKYRWQQVMGNYLQTRDNLKAVVLLCDPRLGLTELDEVLLDVIRPRVEEGLKFLVLLTKSDKLNKTDAAKALQIVKLQAGGGDVKLFSSLKRQGVEEVAQHLWDWAHPKEKPVKAPKAEAAPSTDGAPEPQEPQEPNSIE
ncbi:MAG: ribosome biogenesis GTP-binding protein YihA/YsxC [Polaromonas sp.]|nr:ribosome biogenesis GTP-binding protein YihA/YsxC [Polaromonas sp.]